MPVELKHVQWQINPKYQYVKHSDIFCCMMMHIIIADAHKLSTLKQKY